MAFVTSRIKKTTLPIAMLSLIAVGMLLVSSRTDFNSPLLTACSPNGEYCASVLLNKSRRSNGSDFYRLNIKNVNSLFAWSHWANFGRGQTVLMTTEFRPTRLIWSSPDHLEVICDSCNMSYGDVFGQKTTSGPVIISYKGFVPSIE